MFCKIFIYVHKNLFAPQTWDLLEKLALIFLYNFHREHGSIKFIRKKVIAENQCEKHKKSSYAIHQQKNHATLNCHCVQLLECAYHDVQQTILLHVAPTNAYIGQEKIINF